MMISVPQWTRFKSQLTAERDYENATHEVAVRIEFRHESGEVRSVRAFWDGARVWRFRFSPHLQGNWTWRIAETNASFDVSNGVFRCDPYAGNNPLYRHGILRVSESRHNFENADGTPFLWIGDTVWNGPLKATSEDWQIFLADREQKGFNAIQFVTTQWVAGAGNADLRLAFAGQEQIRIDPAFFQWLDSRVDDINAHGMLAVPALVWSAPSKHWALGLNPGTALPEDQILVLAQYLVARYGAHHVAWMLAADGDYRGELAERWRRIGRALFGDGSQVATMHPMGCIWVGDEFKSEPWFQFHGYQSSHWLSEEAMRWIVEGPPNSVCDQQPHHPVINLEPCYEGHLDMTGAPAPGRQVIDAHAVRRACYWSLLASPPAGITYGAHGVWGWELTPQTPMNHTATGVAPSWKEGMRLPGSSHMTILKQIFESVRWWELRPAQEMLASQPGSEDARLFVSAAQSVSKDLALLYLPQGGCVQFVAGHIADDSRAHWISPTTGQRQAALGGPYFQAPGDGDWVLLFDASATT